MQTMFWKTPLSLSVFAFNWFGVPDGARLFLFLIVSILALAYWINKTSSEYLKPNGLNWKSYLQLTYQNFIDGFK